MKQLFDLLPNKICKFGLCLALACTLCSFPASAEPAASEQTDARQSHAEAAAKEAEPQRDSLITEQPDGSPSQVKLHDYLEEATLQSKTFLFPQDAFEDAGGAVFNAYRKYLYDFEKTPEGTVAHFRHYEFGLSKDQKRQAFPYDLPICSGRGLSCWFSQHNIIAAFDELMDGTEAVFCALPPNDNAGSVYAYKGTYCKMGQKLFTIKTPAGTFKDCLSVTSCSRDGSAVDGANLTFYAPKLGEILNLVYDAKSQQYRIKAVMVSCRQAEEPVYSPVPPGLSLGRYMCAANLSEKILAVADNSGKKASDTNVKLDSCTVYKLNHPEGFGRSKVYWLRFDKVEQLKNSDKAKNPPVKGVDFLDAETDSVMRMCDEAPEPNTVIPPMKSADTNYQFNHKWYKLSSHAFNITTNAGKFDNCLRVTFYGDTPDVLDGNSYQAYFAPDLGEICREYYNSETKKFESSEILLKFSVGSAKAAPVKQRSPQKDLAPKDK